MRSSVVKKNGSKQTCFEPSHSLPTKTYLHLTAPTLSVISNKVKQMFCPLCRTILYDGLNYQ